MARRDKADSRARRLRRLLIASLAATVVLAVPAPAGAKTLYAEPSGDGPHPCSSANPCDIVDAVEISSVGGDEVVLLVTVQVAGSHG